MTTAKGRSMLARARKLGAQKGGPRLLTIIGNPEIQRLKDLGLLAVGAMGSSREAMIGNDHYVAAPDEATRSFHARLLKIAQRQGAFWVMLGCPENLIPMRQPAPYPPARTVEVKEADIGPSPLLH